MKSTNTDPHTLPDKFKNRDHVLSVTQARSSDNKHGFLINKNLPNAITIEEKEKFLEVLASGPFDVSRAREAVGWFSATFDRVMASDEIFSRCVAEIKVRHINKVEQHLADKALNSNHPAYTIFYLKSHKREVYGDKIEQNHSHKVTIDTRQLDQAKERQSKLEDESANLRKKAIDVSSTSE